MIEPTYIYRARLIRVIDGDTFIADVDLGMRVHHHVHLRLFGVDAPERGQPGADEATAAVAFHLSSPFVVRTIKDKQTFGRWLADVYVSTGESLADLLIQEGHAVPA